MEKSGSQFERSPSRPPHKRRRPCKRCAASARRRISLGSRATASRSVPRTLVPAQPLQLVAELEAVHFYQRVSRKWPFSSKAVSADGRALAAHAAMVVTLAVNSPPPWKHDGKSCQKLSQLRSLSRKFRRPDCARRSSEGFRAKTFLTSASTRGSPRNGLFLFVISKYVAVTSSAARWIRGPS